MKTKLILLLASLVVTASSADSSKPDSDVIQGKWEGTEKDAPAGSPRHLDFSGKTLDYHGADTNDWVKGTFTLHENVKPKQMVAVITDCADSDAIGKSVYCIYKLENGAFTVTGSPPGETNFPASFDADGARQMVFKRKPAE